MAARTKGRRVQKHPSKPPKHGKREESPQPARKLRLFRLTICAVIFFAAVAIKLLAPNLMDTYRSSILNLMGENTDFVEVFSAVGRAMGGDVEDALNEAYVAVFGPQEEDTAVPAQMSQEVSATTYTAENTPSQAQLLQEVLGFTYQTPLRGTLSDGFGYRKHPVSGTERFHYGLDITAEEGSVITAFAAGTVTAIGEASDLGKYVEIAHHNGYSTLYAHCSRVTASNGQTVTPGDPVAEVGQTGQATGPHLHFELHRNTTYLNPIYYVELA